MESGAGFFTIEKFANKSKCRSVSPIRIHSEEKSDQARRRRTNGSDMDFH